MSQDLLDISSTPDGLGGGSAFALSGGDGEVMAGRVPQLRSALDALQRDVDRLADQLDIASEPIVSWMSVFNGYIGVMAVAFVVTLVMTPVCRWLAMMGGVVDRPDARKVHKRPIAYLGGLAVYFGIISGILVSYIAYGLGPESVLMTFHPTDHPDPQSLDGLPLPVPLFVVLGITVIMLIGLFDDVTGLSPRIKVAGQLLAAAFLAYSDVGVKLAQGVLAPTIGAWTGNRDLSWTFEVAGALEFLQPLDSGVFTIDLIYWSGTVVIAVFVLGACNASNLIDGLDGLLSGTTAIATLGLLAISIMMLFDPQASGVLDGMRLVLCMAVCGACLGFLPHNFNPATIFLGDCGSLLLGFVTIVIVLTLGDTGRTDLVIAGLIVYAIPIIDTTLAIIRRKMSGKRMSDPDSDHLHHMLKRALGVKGAVLTLYGIGGGFATLGVLVALSGARMTYTLALLFTAFITFYSIKIARIKALEEGMAARFEVTPGVESTNGSTAVPTSNGAGGANGAAAEAPAETAKNG